MCCLVEQSLTNPWTPPRMLADINNWPEKRSGKDQTSSEVRPNLGGFWIVRDHAPCLPAVSTFAGKCPRSGLRTTTLRSSRQFGTQGKVHTGGCPFQTLEARVQAPLSAKSRPLRLPQFAGANSYQQPPQYGVQKASLREDFTLLPKRPKVPNTETMNLDRNTAYLMALLLGPSPHLPQYTWPFSAQPAFAQSATHLGRGGFWINHVAAEGATQGSGAGSPTRRTRPRPPARNVYLHNLAVVLVEYAAEETSKAGALLRDILLATLANL